MQFGWKAFLIMPRWAEPPEAYDSRRVCLYVFHAHFSATVKKLSAKKLQCKCSATNFRINALLCSYGVICFP